MHHNDKLFQDSPLTCQSGTGVLFESVTVLRCDLFVFGKSPSISHQFIRRAMSIIKLADCFFGYRRCLEHKSEQLGDRRAAFDTSLLTVHSQVPWRVAKGVLMKQI